MNVFAVTEFEAPTPLIVHAYTKFPVPLPPVTTALKVTVLP